MCSVVTVVNAVLHIRKLPRAVLSYSSVGQICGHHVALLGPLLRVSKSRCWQGCFPFWRLDRWTCFQAHSSCWPDSVIAVVGLRSWFLTSYQLGAFLCSSGPLSFPPHAFPVPHPVPSNGAESSHALNLSDFCLVFSDPGWAKWLAWAHLDKLGYSICFQACSLNYICKVPFALQDSIVTGFRD